MDHHQLIRITGNNVENDGEKIQILTTDGTDFH